MSSPEVWKKFREYPWDSDAQWIKYRDSIEIPSGPSTQAIERIKYRFYKKFIDPDFDPTVPTYAAAPPPSRPAASPPPTYNPGAPSPASQPSAPRSAPPPPGSPPSMLHSRWNQLQMMLFRMGIQSQFIWILAHSAFLICAVLYLIPLGFSYSAYYIAVLCSATAYGISLFSSIGFPKMNAAYMNTMLANDNFHYLFLSLALMTAMPLTVVLVPLAVYAFYHMCSFMRNNSTRVPPQYQTVFRDQIQPTIDKALARQQEALIWCAQMEYLSMVMILLNLFMGRSDVSLVIGFYWFLSFRYRSNVYSKEVFIAMRDKVKSTVMGLAQRFRPGGNA